MEAAEIGGQPKTPATARAAAVKKHFKTLKGAAVQRTIEGTGATPASCFLQSGYTLALLASNKNGLLWLAKVESATPGPAHRLQSCGGSLDNLQSAGSCSNSQIKNARRAKSKPKPIF